MKEIGENRELTVGGGSKQAKFSVREEDFVRMFRLVRSSLYSHKIEAVLREYASNAWDEHRECGKADVPIQVIMPTALAPSLSIRDFGRGLSEEALYDVFGNLARSTKTTTDEALGTFGIGSKSGFAYADTYTITSWHDGKKIIVVATLDEEDNGQLTTLHVEDSDAPTGIEILIPVQSRDLYAFRYAATKIFPFFHPLPTVHNLGQDLKPFYLDFPQGTPGRGPAEGWWAWMGPNIYPIDLARIDWDQKKFPIGSRGVLRFEIGEVAPAPSREALQYTDRTKAALRTRLLELAEANSKELEARILSLSPFLMQREVNTWLNSGKLSLRPRKSHMRLVPENWTQVPADGSGVSLAERAPCEFSHASIGVDAERILFADVSCKDSREVIARPRNLSTLAANSRRKALDEVEAWLRAHLDAMGMAGLPIVRASTVSSRVTRSYYNAKHHQRVFRFTGDRYKDEGSSVWAVETELNDDDLITKIERFQSSDRLRQYFELCELLGEIPRRVIGVKDTVKKPFVRSEWADYTFLSDYIRELKERVEADPNVQAWVRYAVWASKKSGMSQPKGYRSVPRYLVPYMYQAAEAEFQARYPLLRGFSHKPLEAFYMAHMDAMYDKPRVTLASGWDEYEYEDEDEKENGELRQAAN